MLFFFLFPFTAMPIPNTPFLKTHLPSSSREGTLNLSLWSCDTGVVTLAQANADKVSHGFSGGGRVERIDWNRLYVSGGLSALAAITLSSN